MGRVTRDADRVEAHFAALRNAIEAADGSIFSTMGDGVAAAFTSAHAAVEAAIAAQHRLVVSGLTVRMGLHTGEAERVGDDYRGRSVNRAARVMAIGHGGQILLSDITAALVRNGPNPAELIDLGTHRLRDLNDPERVWQVVDADLPQHFPMLRGLDTYSNNLPAQRSSLVGREADAARVDALLHDHRIVTLTGVGGVGKTRLALQVAADVLSRYSDVWFVGLASVADSDDVADTIARAIGAGPVLDPTTTAAALIGREPVLLLVDNCEHVVDAAALVIDTLTAACPHLTVITTSREALGIDGEHIVAVRSLDPATTAVELFEQRAASAGADLTTIGSRGDRVRVPTTRRYPTGHRTRRSSGTDLGAGQRHRGVGRPVQSVVGRTSTCPRPARHHAGDDRLVISAPRR